MGDCGVCCLGCLSLIPGVKKTLLRKVAFFPPNPRGYFVAKKEEKDEGASSSSSDPEVFLTDFDPVEALLQGQEFSTEEDKKRRISSGGWRDRNPRLAQVMARLEPMPDLKKLGLSVEPIFLTTKRKNRIVGFHFKHLEKNRPLMLCSHGNSCDIGVIFHLHIDMALGSGADIMCYDYAGYGCSTGTPSEENMYSDLEAVFAHASTLYKKKEIILYGQSIGSAPTTWLASRLSEEELGGVVLESAFKSGLTVVRQDLKKPPWFDVLKNLSRVKNILVPILLIHGTEDQEVPIEHSVALLEQCRNPVSPWWAFGAGHNSISHGVFRRPYLEKLRNFVLFITGEETVSLPTWPPKKTYSASSENNINPSQIEQENVQGLVSRTSSPTDAESSASSKRSSKKSNIMSSPKDVVPGQVLESPLEII